MAKKSATHAEEEKDTFSLLTDFDIHLFRSGKHFKLYEKLGAHPANFKKSIRNLFRRLGSQRQCDFGDWQFQLLAKRTTQP